MPFLCGLLHNSHCPVSFGLAVIRLVRSLPVCPPLSSATLLLPVLFLLLMLLMLLMLLAQGQSG